jgi:hypothetical protein
VSVVDQAVLTSRLALALARIGVDRCLETQGRSLPRTPEQLAVPEVLNELVRRHPSSALAGLPPIVAARLPGVEFESSNCRNFLIEVDFDEASREASEGSRPLPKTLYAKIPCAERGTRAFAEAVGFWEAETVFCQQVAPRVPVRVPRVYAAAKQGARFVLLLENLNETPGTRLFINRDMARGSTPDRARMCLRAFAELHAAFWDTTRVRQEELLPRRLHTYLAPGGREMTRALNGLSIGPAHKAAPDVFMARHVALCREAIQKWDALLEAWYGGALTLIHGDSHLANCFEHETPDGPRMGLIDFQGTHWCKGMRDVQYFLINSLEPDILAQHEDSLIDFYLAELKQRGVSLDGKLAREQYRAFSFQTLMVAVTSIGLGSLTERDETVRTVLRRSVAAIDRLRFGAWLDAL